MQKLENQFFKAAAKRALSNSFTIEKLYNKKGCYICGANNNLNIEAVIHHNSRARCIDLKACKKRQRKAKKKCSN
jgi:hypothetical protein